MTASPPWQLLLYRLPSTPSRARVSVWRELRRLGALPLQQGVVAVPELGDLPARLEAVAERARAEQGSVHRFRLTELDADQQARLREEWSALRRHEFAEIVEECETKFAREVEFEIFRGNLTGSEAEEIEADLEKLRRWLARVVERDLFGADNRAEAERAVARCEALLDDFVERVYRAEAEHGPSVEPPADVPWGSGGGEVGERRIVPLRDGERGRRPA